MCASPEISVRGYGERCGSRSVETVEILAVEPNQVTAIDDQPQKTIRQFARSDLPQRPGRPIVDGEMGTEEVARWLVWIKRADRDT